MLQHGHAKDTLPLSEICRQPEPVVRDLTRGVCGETRLFLAEPLPQLLRVLLRCLASDWRSPNRRRV
eukprot:3496915-Rhodomonas_salina.1